MRVPHHLIDILDPTEAYSAARFRIDALAAIAAIRARGRVPLVVGGTMLYFKALREGLSALPAADPATRARIDARARGGRLAGAARGARAGRSRNRSAPSAHGRAAHPARARGARAHRHSALAASRRARRRRCARADRSRSRSCPPTGRGCTRRSPSASTRCSTPGWSTNCGGCARGTRSRPTCRRCAASATGRRGRFWTARSTPRRFARKGIAATRQLAKRQLTWLRATPAAAFDPYTPGLADAVGALLLREGVGRASVARDARPVALTTPRMR